MFERFTEHARLAVRAANQHAIELRNAYVGAEHLLLGLFDQKNCVAFKSLAKQSVQTATMCQELLDKIKQGPEDISLIGQLPQTPRFKRVIELATNEAREMLHDFVGTEHLLLGLLKETEGIAFDVLSSHGLNYSSTQKTIYQLLSTDAESSSATDESGDENSSNSDSNEWNPVTRLLNDAISSNQAIDLLGRYKTGVGCPDYIRPGIIQPILNALNQRVRNCVMLIGDHQFASLVVENVVSQFAEESNHHRFRDVKLIKFSGIHQMLQDNTTGLEQVSKLIADATRPGNVIMVIDRFSELVSGSKYREELVAGEFADLFEDTAFRCIAIVTRKNIERVRRLALMNSFIDIELPGPNDQEIDSIVRYRIFELKNHHLVNFEQHAVDEAVKTGLSLFAENREILADTIIEILDEAASTVALNNDRQVGRDVLKVQQEIQHLVRKLRFFLRVGRFESVAPLKQKIEQLKRERVRLEPMPYVTRDDIQKVRDRLNREGRSFAIERRVN